MNKISYSTDPATGDPIVELDGTFGIMDVKTIIQKLLDMTGRMPSAAHSGSFAITPIVSGSTGEPKIELQAPVMDAPVQLSHAEAFSLAHALLEVTSMAINDAMLFGWLITYLGIEKAQAAGMLESMRAYRDQALGNGQDSQEGGQP